MQRRDKARATDAPRGTLFGASPWIAGALGLLVSLPALGGGFVWDDRWLILQSPVLRDPGNLPRLLMEGHGWGSIILTEDGSAYYRPLATLLHGLLLLLFGAHPLPFRILSGLLHAGTSVVLALLLRRLSPRAMWGAALFAVHPALADAFGWISATPDLLATGLLIGAMAVLFAPRQRPVIVGVLWLFALLSKESSAIGVLWAAILWAALGRFSLDPSGNAGPLRSRSGTVDSPSRPPIASRALPADFSARRALLAIAVATAVYLILRAVGPGFHRPAGEYPAGVEASGATLVGRLWLFNFLSLLVPINPTLNPPAWVIGSAGSGVGLIGFAAAVAATCVAAWLLLRRREGGTLRMLAIGYLLALAALLPVSQIVKTNDLFGGRFLYLPAAGLCVGIGLAIGTRARPYSRAARIAFLALLLGMGVRSGFRASEWRDEARLHGGEYRRRPENARAQILWASHLMNEGRWMEARPLIEGTVARLPDNPGVRALQAQLWVNEGKIREAEAVYAGLVRSWRRTPTLLANLAACQMRLGRLEEGLATLDEATRLSSPTPGMRNNRGNALRLLGRDEEARREFEQAIAEDPDYVPARLNLIFLLAHRIGDGQAAGRAAEEFIRRFPGETATPRVRGLLDSLSTAPASPRN